MRFVKRNKRSKKLPLEGELVTSSSESLTISSKSPDDPTRQSGIEAETNTSESKQTWPGLLESADKVRIPIKARDKVGYSSEEIQSFPDMFLDELNIEEGKAILASIRGDLKRHQGFLRQDSAIIETVSLGLSAKYVLLIVADGVGSKRDSHLESPTSLFFLTVADSGERKSSGDHHFMKAVFEYDVEQEEIFRKEKAQYDADVTIWESECAGIRDKIRADSRTNKDISK